ncbi:hypothetical protein FOA52_001788 [Chlamydomonas sp. UWO 241]|nr:hypothetical protein FOA52_001788 [Chlamydomonas sp. UWO 241]
MSAWSARLHGKCHYEGRFEDGRVFDSSRGGSGPISVTIGVGMVISGWDLGILGSEQEGIPPMRVGGRRRLVVPPELGYGSAGFGNGLIPPHTVLEFDVELLGPPNALEQLWGDAARLLSELRSGV